MVKMSFKRDVKSTYGLHEVAVSKNKHENNLAHMGYPTLYQVSFFIRSTGLPLWIDKKEIYFPQKCCICGEASSILLPNIKSKKIFFLRQSDTLIKSVPHCAEHGLTKCQLIVSVIKFSDKTIQISLTGTNLDFLLETKKMNKKGDVFPPWEAFPDYEVASSAWRQGIGEYWWNTEWAPFWNSLTSAVLQEYLTKTVAPLKWIEYLTSDFG